MKYSDHPMPLVEGEAPWVRVMVLDTNTNKFKMQWRQMEPEDYRWYKQDKWEGQIPETDTYELEDKDEFYDFITCCKACSTEFIAYGRNQNPIRNYCPGCGKQLVKQEAEDEQARAESGE